MSRTVASVAESSPLTEFLKRALARWRGGAMVALVTAFALPLWWRLEESFFEAEAVLEQQGDSVEKRRNDLDALKARLAEGTRERAASPGTSLLPPPGPAFSLSTREDEKLVLKCLGRSAQAAQAACDQMVGTLDPNTSTLRVVPGGTRTGAASSLMRTPVVLLGVGAGLLTGLLWMVLGALLSRQKAVPDSVTQSVRPRPAADTEELSFERPPRGWRFANYAPSAGGAPGTALALPTSGGPLGPLQDLSREIDQLATRRPMVIGVSSAPESRVRKSLVAGQLASMLGSLGRARVLLLEADVEDPAVDRVMRINVPSMGGFSQQLQWRDPQTVQPWSVVQCGPNLSVLAEGRVRVLGQLHSERFMLAIAQLRRQFDIIVVDGPLLGHDEDILKLDRISDGVVIVSSARADASSVQQTAASTFSQKPLFSLLLADPA